MDLDTVVERLADLLERPLVVYDGDLNVAAYSVHGVDADEARQRSILSRQATPRAREMLRAHVTASSVAPVRLPVEDGFPERIAVAVRHDGHMSGVPGVGRTGGTARCFWSGARSRRAVRP